MNLPTRREIEEIIGDRVEAAYEAGGARGAGEWVMRFIDQVFGTTCVSAVRGLGELDIPE